MTDPPSGRATPTGRLVLIEDIDTSDGRPVDVECPQCLRRADRVLAYGHAGQRGAVAAAVEHRLLPCGHLVRTPLEFRIR